MEVGMSHKLSESHNLLWCYDVVVRPQAVQKHMGREGGPSLGGHGKLTWML